MAYKLIINRVNRVYIKIKNRIKFSNNVILINYK